MSNVTPEMEAAGVQFRAALTAGDLSGQNVRNRDLAQAVLGGEISPEKAIYEAMERARPYKPPTIADTMYAMSKSVNAYSGSAEKSRKAVTDVFSVEHRTLQQLIFSTYVVSIIRVLAEMGRNGRTDARNQRAAEVAVALDEVLERIAKGSGGEIYFPFI